MGNTRVLICLMIASFFLSANSLALDTLNHVDENNMKQGLWVYTNKVKKLPNYNENQIVEKGHYSDDKRIGKWVFYYNNDKVKQVLTYINNRPDGHAVFYYKNGNKKEEGTWINNKWVGSYTYYYENGQTKNDWVYNQSGQRTGIQKYYFKNGQLMIEGEWSNGKELGKITEYYIDGSIKSERSFNNGTIDPLKIKKYDPQEKLKETSVASKEVMIHDNSNKNSSVVLKTYSEKNSKNPWNGTGNRQFFNKKGQILREGYFENGYIVNGSVYLYNSAGQKRQTITYTDSKITNEIVHKTKQ